MSFKDTLFSNNHTINCSGTIMDLTRPKIMGILNVTPDSFYDGGRSFTEKDIHQKVSEMVQEGVDILDVGGYSSRPGAADISSEEEKERLKKGIQIIRNEFPDLPLSVDTFRSEIAEYAVKEFGACIINDISAGRSDDRMFQVVSTHHVTYLMMHMQGNPRIMQVNPQYGDVTREVIAFFAERIAVAREAGIKDIIIDPGFGFGKTVNHNYTLLRELGLFEMLDCPVAIGISRKSMVYKPLGMTPDDALTGTVALHALALLNGAVILRVHDVKEAVQTVKLVDLYLYGYDN